MTATDQTLALVFFIHSHKIDANADTASEEIQSHPKSEVGFTCPSPKVLPPGGSKGILGVAGNNTKPPTGLL